MRKKQLQHISEDSPQLPKKRIKSKTIEEVETDIENSKNQINNYRTTLEQTKAPMVQELPFFSLPSTRREMVNSALASLWTINKSTYNTIAEALSTINNNTDSLNNLIRILAVAEADLYTKLNRLSNVNKKESKNVDKLSKDIKQTAENANKLSVIQKKMAILRKESLTNLGERFTQIEDNICQKANQSDVKDLSESVKSQGLKIVQLDGALKTKADEAEVNKMKSQLNYIKIAHRITTATLLAGLITSFLI